MIGPVCYLELLHLHRRVRQRLFCLIYGGWLLAEFGVLYLGYLMRSGSVNRPVVRIEAASDFITTFVELFVVQQYALLLLVTPALVAGTITDEKTRGTLQHLLTTELTSAEIILGKLLGQFTRLLELALVGFPLLAFTGALGGVEFAVMLAVFLSPLLPLLAVGSVSLLASVWCRSTREAVLSVYVLGGLALLTAWGIGGAEHYLDPRYVLEPAWEDSDGHTWVQRWLETGQLWVGVAILCMILAIWRLRPGYARQLVAQRRRGGHQDRPPIGDLPLYWKARYAEALVSLPLLRSVPERAGWLVAGVLGILLPFALLPDSGGIAFHFLGLCVALGAGLLVGVRCSGAVTGERESQTWEALLLTPLEPKQLLRSKLLGARDTVWFLVLAYGGPAMLLSVWGGLTAVLWTVFWIWGSRVVMYWMGSCGIACSMKSATSWHSLLTTLLTGYRTILFRLAASFPLGCLISCLVNLALIFVYHVIDGLLQARIMPRHVQEEVWFMVYLMVIYVVTGFELLAVSEARLQDAEKQLASEERVRQRRGSPLSPEERNELVRQLYR